MMPKYYTMEELFNTPVSELMMDDVDMTSWNNPMTEEEADLAIEAFDAQWFNA